MRIIAGTFRGKKILEPKDTLTRPLKDLTKELKGLELDKKEAKEKKNGIRV